MARLELFLFGPPRLVRAGHTLNLGLRKAFALFIYLAVTKQPHSRDALATLFWPEEGQRSARGNLRRALHRINEALQAEMLVHDGENVSLDPGADLWIDSEAFTRHRLAALAAGDLEMQPVPAAVQALEAAAALYTDDFLAGFTLPDSPAFDEWQFFQREGLRHALAAILAALAKQYHQAGNLAQAIEWARRRLALDRLDEGVHRELMALYAGAGQVGAALRQYQECVRLLDTELGAAPEEATTRLFEALRSRRFTPATDAPDHLKAGQPSPDPTPATEQTTGPRHNLPPQTTPFIGRQHEVASTCRRLDDPACRLLTLIGPGGCGKTRLAIQAAQQLFDAAGPSFADGVCFVSLAPLQQPEEIAPAIVAALGLAFAADRSPAEALQNFLHERRLLLLLDNFEHLIPAAAEIGQLLAAGPGVKLLVTSRRALNLAEEWFHVIDGLEFPEEEEERRPLAHYDAVRLFEQCARRVQAGFSLEQASNAVVQICRLVDGMPLALELAAAWLHTLSAQTVAGELAKGIEILTARHSNLPVRHRSMRTVLAQSWAMLAEPEQGVLARFSVFRGGFTLHAAEQVAGATVATLATLVEKALVRATPGERYQMHELLRQFAAGQLSAQPGDEAAARTAHSRYYLHFLTDFDRQLYSKRQGQALDVVGQEIDNLRTAWDWALAHGELDLVEQAVAPLYRFYWVRCRNREGEALFSQALAHLQQTPALHGHPCYEPTLLHLTSQRALFYSFRGEFDACERDERHALALARRLGQQQEEGYLLAGLGVLAVWRGKGQEAHALLDESLSLFTALEHPNGRAHVLQEQATLQFELGDYAGGERLAAESLAISRQIERPDWTAWAYDSVGFARFAVGDYAAAHEHYRTALAMFERIGHERGFALTTGGLGRLAWAQGEGRLAEDLLAQSLAILHKIGYRLHIASRLGFLAWALNERNELSAALDHAQEGLEIASALNSPATMAYNLCALADTARRRQEFVTARRHLRQSLLLTGRCSLWPALMMGFYHTAGLLLDEAAHGVGAAAMPVTAPDLLSLVAGRPATWGVFRSRGRRLLGEVEPAFMNNPGQEPAALSALAEQVGQAL
jgi:predicted ATPase